MEGTFSDTYNPTIEHSKYCLSSRKEVPWLNCAFLRIFAAFSKTFTYGGVKYSLHLVDTAGQDESNILPETYVMNVDGYILVYSVDSLKSFEVVKVIREKILDRTGNCNLPIVLVGESLNSP